MVWVYSASLCVCVGGGGGGGACHGLASFGCLGAFNFSALLAPLVEGMGFQAISAVWGGSLGFFGYEHIVRDFEVHGPRMSGVWLFSRDS